MKWFLIVIAILVLALMIWLLWMPNLIKDYKRMKTFEWSKAPKFSIRVYKYYHEWGPARASLYNDKVKGFLAAYIKVRLYALWYDLRTKAYADEFGVLWEMDAIEPDKAASA